MNSKSRKQQEAPGQDLPADRAAAVAYVLARLSQRSKANLRSMKSEDEVATACHFTVGPAIRNMLGLWERNEPLLRNMPDGYAHPDSATGFILCEWWRQMRDLPPSGLPPAKEYRPGFARVTESNPRVEDFDIPEELRRR